MANLGLISGAPVQAIRNNYNAAIPAPANPHIQWPSIGSGSHMREKEYVPIVSPFDIAAGVGLTTGRPVFA